MSENGINTFGRIKYIEPNDFIENSEFSYTHPYEDYSISVDLLVDVPNRVYNIPINGSDTIGVTETNKTDTITFFGGTDGYMTDIPGTLIYQDILNKDSKGLNESLGITNIHITYNSYFYPEITIQFTDVRANALMAPNEEIYSTTERNEQCNVQNFFASLFSFPYPEFKLRIKGFYGKKVEYSLLVNDFRSSFNNQTGNFDATVKFIGRMYGVYTDIPMLYLLVAPYYKNNDNEENIWDSHQFTFDDGTLMPTFLGLRKILQEVEYNSEDLINQKDITTYQKGQEKVAKLTQLKENCSAGFNLLLKTDNVYNCGNNVYLFPKDTELPAEFVTICHLPQESSINTKIDGITQSDNIYTIDKSYEITFNKENGNSSYSMNSKNEFIESVSVELNRALNSFKIKHNSKYYVISGKKLFETIKTQIEDVKKENSSSYNNIINRLDADIIRLLGFKPTVKNIFKMIMAHLQVFMEIYHDFIKKVTGENSRTLEKIGVSAVNTVDVPYNGINELTVPPFPALKNVEDNTYCYPTYVCSNEMEETIFIDNLLKGVDDVVEMIRQLELDLESLRNRKENDELITIPTCLTDFITLKNPYYHVFEKNEGNDYIAWILTYFGIRCIQQFVISHNTNYSENTFGQGEAINFFIANPELSYEIIEQLKNENFNEDNFINFLTNQTTSYIQDSKPVYQNDNKTTKLLISEGSKVRLLREFNFPGALNRNSNSIDSFWEDTKMTNEYSIFKGSATLGFPYYYFKEIKNEDFEKLIQSCQDIDSSKESDFVKQIEKNLKTYEYFYKREITQMGHLLDVDTKNELEDSVILCGKDFHISGDGGIISESDTRLINSENENIEEDLKLYSLALSFNNDSNNNVYYISKGTEPFFNGSNSPSDLLKLIPHNIKDLSDLIYKGEGIFKIPYATQLYLGMILERGFEDDTIKDSENFHGLDKVLLSIIRNNNGSPLLYEKYKENYENHDAYSNFLKNKFSKAHNCLLENGKYKDVFGFGEKYKNWCTEFNKVIDGYNLDVNWDDVLKKCKEEKNSITVDGINSVLIKINEPNAFINRYKYIIVLNDNQLIPIFNKNFKFHKEINNLFKQVDNFVIPFKTYNYDTCVVTIPNDTASQSTNAFLSNNQSSFLPTASNYSIPAIRPLSNTSLTTGITTTQQTNTYVSNLACEKKFLLESFKAFKNGLFELYGINDANESDSSNPTLGRKFKITEETKMSMYLTLKNLYDKHLHSLPLEIDKYDIDNDDSEFKRFHFVDTYFNDLSDELCINLTKLNEVVQAMVGGYADKQNGILESTMSVYSFMALVCEKASMMLMSMPFFNGSLTDKNGDEVIKSMFTPFSYNDSVNDDSLKGPSYVCLYPHQPSRHLDLPNSQYSNDGFNITEPSDLNDTANFDGPSDITDLYNESKYVIPAFGVEYGSQKQSIFKNINVNMDNPQTTEAAVANQFALATKVANVNKLGFEGQDLFRIYSNYSYSCQVDMMGCAQIQPLMYFQLNNIPMFRGAYQIIHVEHNITPGDMSTTFRGVRINRTKIPMVKTCIAAETLESILSTKEYISYTDDSGEYVYGTPNNVYYTKTAGNNNLSTINYDVLNETFGEYFLNQQTKERTNKLTHEMLSLLYDVINDAKANNVGIRLSSAARGVSDTGEYKNSSSDHSYDGNPREIRKKLIGIDGNGNEDRISKMGCAVDIHGHTPGKSGQNAEDKQSISPSIFHAIALNHTPSINQLIWEVTSTSHSGSDNISNCIHLSSYGHGKNSSQNDRCHITVMHNNGGKYVSIVAQGMTNTNPPTNMPPTYIKTIYDLRKKYGYTGFFENIQFTSLANAGWTSSKLTLDVLKSWCEKLGIPT